MASDEQSNQAASESATADEQKNSETTETQTGESGTEDIEQLRSERNALKRDYAALKTDYDKNAHKAKESKSAKSEPEDSDDVMTWMTLNADNLKLVPKEFQEELTFYKSHKIPVTNEIRDRALRDARARKGVRNTEAERQASTSTETQGEMRKTTSNPTEVPENIAKLAKEGGTELTPERYAKYRPEIEERRKKRG